MPIQTSIATLRALTRPALAIRKDRECHLDISPEALRFRARSEDYEAYIDHTIPTTNPEISGTDISGSYCVRFPNLKALFTASCAADVIIRTPAETSNETFTFQSGSLTYRHTPISKTTAHRVFNNITAETTTEISIQNKVFHRAITVANLLGTTLHVCFNHETRQTEFTAEDPASGDSFLYTHRVEQIHSTQPQATELTIPIDRLRDLTPLVPASSTVSLELTPHHLTYRAEHPVTGANLTMYIAEHHDAIDG
jgi:hypothetical protein